MSEKKHPIEHVELFLGHNGYTGNSLLPGLPAGMFKVLRISLLRLCSHEAGISCWCCTLPPFPIILLFFPLFSFLNSLI